MAGEWLKMRVWLAKDPKVIRIADTLAEDRVFMDWLTDPVQRTCSESAYEHVTCHVVVSLVVTGLLQVWGVAVERGHRVGHNLVVDYASLATCDEIAGIPGFGAAVSAVGWVEETADSLLFCKYLRDNSCVDDRTREKARIRKQQQRERERDQSRKMSRDVTHREEKRREEKKTREIPPPTPERVSELEQLKPAPAPIQRPHRDAAIRGLSGRFSTPQIEAVAAAYPAGRVRGTHGVHRAIDRALSMVADRMGGEDPEGSAVAWVLARTKAFAASPAGRRGDFTPTAQRWFDDGGYDDGDEAWQRADPGDGAAPKRDYAALMEKKP